MGETKDTYTFYAGNISVLSRQVKRRDTRGAKGTEGAVSNAFRTQKLRIVWAALDTRTMGLFRKQGMC